MVYQHLMDYWVATMQDDAYLIVHAGWVEAAKPRLIVETKEQKSKEQPDFSVGKQKFKSDLIPAGLLIARYFPSEQDAIEALEAELSALEQQLDEIKEEHGGEGGLMEDLMDEKGKISKKAVTARFNSLIYDNETAEEHTLLENYLTLLDRQAAIKSRLKAAEDALEVKMAARYGTLTEAEIKTLVVDDKWLTQLSADVQSELDRVSQALTGRIRQNWPNATQRRCPRSPRRSKPSPPGWTNISRRWGRYGTEAGLQADRGGGDSGGVGGR